MSDAASIVEHLNNRRVWITLTDRIPFPYTIEHAHEFLLSEMHSEPETSFAIEAEGECVGAAGIRVLDGDSRYTAEIGYWLGEDRWGKGIATEVVKALTAYAFARHPIARIQAHVFAGNTASSRVLEKSGFTLEAQLRQSVVKDGHILDQNLYAILRTGFLQSRTQVLAGS